MRIFVSEHYLFWFEVVNYNASEYYSYFFWINSWIYNDVENPYFLYKTGVLKRYYVKVRIEYTCMKGKSVLVGRGNSLWFYYLRRVRILRGLPNIKFWYFHKNINLYYNIAQLSLPYVDDFKIYDYWQERRNTVIIFADFWAKFRPRHWKFWTKQVRYSHWEIMWIPRFKYDINLMEKKTLMRHWYQWDRLYFLYLGGLKRYVQTEYWMTFYNCISTDIYSSYPEKMLFNHTFFYKIHIKLGFIDFLMSIMQYCFVYVQIPFFFLFTLIKILYFFIILFFFFNLNSFFYKIFFLISYVSTFYYAKFFIEAWNYITFINSKDLYSIFESYYYETKRRHDESQYFYIPFQVNKNKNESKVEAIKKSYQDFSFNMKNDFMLIASIVFFPYFLYIIVYKKSILREMISDLLTFILKSFFFFRKKETNIKNSLLYKSTITFSMFNLFFIYVCILLFWFVYIPVTIVTKISSFLFKFLLRNIYIESIKNIFYRRTVFMRATSFNHSRFLVNKAVDAIFAETVIDDDAIDLSLRIRLWYKLFNPFLLSGEKKMGIGGAIGPWISAHEEFDRKEKDNEFMENRFDEFFYYHPSDDEMEKALYRIGFFRFFFIPYIYMHYFSKLFFIQVKNKYSNLKVDIDKYNAFGFVSLQYEASDMKDIWKLSWPNKIYKYIYVSTYIYFFFRRWKFSNFFKKWNNLSFFFSYFIYYNYFYLVYFIFIVFSSIYSLWIFFINSNRVLIRFYFILYYKAFIKAFRIHPDLIVRFFFHVFTYLVFFLNKILFILIFIKNILLKLFYIVQSRYFLPLNLRLFFVYFYFTFCQYNIIWKMFVFINIKLFHFLTLCFVFTLFIDYDSLYNLYVFFISLSKIIYNHYYINFFMSIESNVLKYLYYEYERFYFYVYEPNNVLVNISVYDRDIILFIRECYEKTKRLGFWSNDYINDAILFCSTKLDIELNWWIMQMNFVLSKIKFVRTSNFIYLYNMSVYWLLVFKHYKFFCFIYCYYFFEWFYHYFFYICIYFLEQYNLDFIFCYVSNNLFYFKAFIFYKYYLFMAYLKYSIIFYWKSLSNYHYLFLDSYPFKFEYKVFRICIFFNWFDFFVDNKIARFFLFVDIIEYYQYICFNYYYIILNFFLSFFFFVNWFFCFLYGNWITYDMNIIIIDFISFLFKLFAPFYLLCEEIFKNLSNGVIDFRYIGSLGWVWPENEKAFDLTLGINVDKFIIESLYIKKQALYNYIFDLKISKNSSFYIYIYLFHFFFAILFVFYFVLFSKNFSSFFKNKYFFSFGPFSSWERLNVDEMTSKTVTDKEWLWVNNLDWITSFKKFHFDVFRGDPFYDWVNKTDICNYLYTDMVQVFLKRNKLDSRNQAYKMIAKLEDYYFERYVRFCNKIYMYYRNEGESLGLNVKKQNKIFFNNNFWVPKKYFQKGNNLRIFRENIAVSFAQWKELYALPYMYAYSDDHFFIERFLMLDNNPVLRWILKFRTILEEKDVWQIDPIDFVFFEQEFWDSLNYDFYHDLEDVLFNNLSKSRFLMTAIFVPIEHLPKLFRPTKGRFDDFYETNKYLSAIGGRATMSTDDRLQIVRELEEKCHKLSKRDETYFNNYFNFTLYGNFSHPQMVTTRIGFGDLDILFNAWDSEQWVEFVPYLPRKFYRSDDDNPVLLERSIQQYWRNVLKHNAALSTKELQKNDMGIDPYWKSFNSMPFFLVFLVLISTAFSAVLDDALYHHKQPFEIISAISSIINLFVQKLYFEHYINDSGWGAFWQTMPGMEGFIAVENFEFVFLGSTPSFWNFFYTTSDKEELRFLISTKMFLHAHGVERDPYFLLMDWLGYKPRELFEGPADNFKLRNHASMTSDYDMQLKTNIFFYSIIKFGCMAYGFYLDLFADWDYFLIYYIISFILFYFFCRILPSNSIVNNFYDRHLISLFKIYNDLPNKK